MIWRCHAKYHDDVTIPREALIEKLVVTLHLNVPERQMLGSDDVSVTEVAAVVKRCLSGITFFHRTLSRGRQVSLCLKDSSSGSVLMEKCR